MRLGIEAHAYGHYISLLCFAKSDFDVLVTHAVTPVTSC